ncbi:aminotransferase class I/II-fold pyridoxal phosphate-dependent enzyme [Nocardia sp. NBC_00881]|uniref:aminotransferase class I/II-fold pyridoxal phosphate-dependent enzyme n=1 Tax=Nocardia sp. NBC_00881 TaxID=2975995 RepID=UPI0038675A11|nr:aminotransferase class I/II-fold pyridoxal phosphate-dependent enzyme [Nocardia sp. NBC_00881]
MTEAHTRSTSGRSGRFIALEGPDGAGKTTLAAQLAEIDYDTALDRLASVGTGQGLVFVSRRQISRTSAYAAALMEHLSTMLWHSGDDPVLSDGFWASLQAAWFTAHSETVIAPLLASGFDVLVDGWLGKFSAQLVSQSFTESALEVVFERVLKPDAVVLLATDPAAAYDRGREFRASELGMHTGLDGHELGRDSFITYQTRTADTLGLFAQRRGWRVVDVASSESVDDTVSRLSSVITELRHYPSTAATVSAHLLVTGDPRVPTGRGGSQALDAQGSHYRWPAVDEGLEKAVTAQMHRSLSDRDARGVIGEFESAFAEFVGTGFAVSFSSGTSAIHAMSRAAGLRPGDGVIAPAYTFFATASPFAHDGIEVSFADADPVTGNVTAATLAAAIRLNTRAVIVTHMWGVPCRMDEIVELCRERGLMLLEDCSHAHFASWRGQRVGTFGDMAAFSCNQKAITTGEGGVLVTNSRTHRDHALLFGHYNKRCLIEIDSAAAYYGFAVTGMGVKHRITTLGAAIGVHELGRATEIESRRRATLDRYTTGLAANPVVSPVLVDPASRHGLYVLGLRFHPERALVSREQFVALCHSEGAHAIDIAGSTRDISGEPLFARTDPFAAWTPPPPRPRPHLPGVEAFDAKFVKLPLWGYDGDEPLVERYLAVLDKVSRVVAL